MAAPAYKLIDENTDLTIAPDYDPLVKDTFEDYIHITEKVNPGRRTFNQVPDQTTRDIHVTGLVLYWGKSMKKSKLRAVLDRTNIEHLYLYADTVIVDTPLHFPQTHVTIYARRLIMGEDGCIDTSPTPFANPYPTDGTKPEDRDPKYDTLAGSDGTSAGDITLFVKHCEFDERPVQQGTLTIHPDNEIVPTSMIRPEIITPANFNPAWQLHPEGTEIAFDCDQFEGNFVIFLVERIPDNNQVRSHETPHVLIQFYHRPEGRAPERIKITYKDGHVQVTGATGPITKQGLTPDKARYFGFWSKEGHASPIKNIEVTYTHRRPFFVLRGADGQHGERGALRVRKTSDKVPVSWDEVLNEVLPYDAWESPRDQWETTWDWPVIDELKDFGMVYYAKLTIFNPHKDENTDKIAELGDKSVEHPCTGRDAYASGGGGQGGQGGTLRLTNVALPPGGAELRGGAGGLSEYIAGEPQNPQTDSCKNSTALYLHMEYTITHVDGWGKQVKTPSKHSTKDIMSRDGRPAKGDNGLPGAAGALEVLSDQATAWLHPYVLGVVAQYARDTFLAGDRKPAKWLLQPYQKAFQAADASVFENLHLTNLRNEIDLVVSKIDNNLDYFGNPVGWVPRLSAVTNIDLLKQSRPVIVQLLHYAEKLVWEEQASEEREEQLDFLVQQLTEEIDAARKNLIAAYDQLDDVKTELDKIGLDTSTQMSAIRALEAQVKGELMQQEQEQAIFTGACKLAAGLCQVIPVGQPYVGQIGGSLLSNIAEIDIHSDNPLGEAIKTSAAVATDLSTFVKDNKGKITDDVTASLRKNIADAQSDIDDLDDDLDARKKDLAECKQELEERFGDQLAYLRGALTGMQTATSMDEAEFYVSDEYQEIIQHTEYLKREINDIEGLDSAEKQAIKAELARLGAEKKDLITRLEGYTAKQKKRTKGIKKATKYLENVGKGISGVADGLQTMMTPVDPESDAFRTKIEQAKSTKYKAAFKDLFDEVDTLNARKQKAAQQLVKLEGVIAASCQTLSTNMIQVSTFNDQRAQEVERQLNPMTKLFLTQVIQNTWELLRAEMYYLVKSYQYRFARKVDPAFFSVDTLIKDINTFFTTNGIQAPNETQFEQAFNTVIQGLFVRLVLDLLTDRVQNLPDIKKFHYAVTLTGNATTPDGRAVLRELSDRGKVTFRLHELGIDSKGSGQECFYRIENIVFKNIEVAFSDEARHAFPDIDDRISFRFGLAHSGDSVIRDETGTYFFFTTRSPESDKRVVQNVRSWQATYNGAEREAPHHGIDNEQVSTTDRDILIRLLSDLQETDFPLTYAGHLPAATSELTLAIEKHNLDVDFEITKLDFDFHYEVMPGSLRRSAAAPDLPESEA